MKDLVERTGMSKEAIRFYLAEGLLPPPIKSARNMAWYGQEHVEGLRQIRRLREDHFLSLKAIRLVLNGGDESQFTPAQLESLQRMRQRLLAEQTERNGVPPEQLAQELGLSPGEWKELALFGVGVSETLSCTDVEIAKIWVKMRDAYFPREQGFGPRDKAYILDAVRLMLDHEVEFFRDRLKHLGPDQLEGVIRNVVPALNQLFVLLHERALIQFIHEHAERGAKRLAEA